VDRHRENRFQDFFEDGKYVVLKNHLYNYILRKRAIERILVPANASRILEIGSGISPVMTKSDRVVYTELSFLAISTLKREHGRGAYVVADGTRLPFRDGAFSHAVSSEVLEHVPDDRAALGELSRVIETDGKLVVTFPHRKFYFMYDDRFVEHCRRYELHEMTERLEEARFSTENIEKVLGPLEKLTMLVTIGLLRVLIRLRPSMATVADQPSGFVRALAPFFKWMNRGFACLAWADAKIWPRSLSTVLLIEAQKR
jgi:SAM-dependent methyltransferase